jgi:hypothetical protein
MLRYAIARAIPGPKRATESHAKVRAMHRRNGVRWSGHFDLCCTLAPKDE